MARKLTNVETYLIIIFLFLIVVTGLARLGLEMIDNDNAALDNDSIEYIAQLNGIDISRYNATEDQIERSVLINDNGSQGNPKDYALDFLFAKEKGFGIEIVIKGIFSLPEVILVNMLRFDKNDWDWLLFILNWLYRLLIIIALYYFVRGLIDK